MVKTLKNLFLAQFIHRVSSPVTVPRIDKPLRRCQSQVSINASLGRALGKGKESSASQFLWRWYAATGGKSLHQPQSTDVALSRAQAD